MTNWRDLTRRLRMPALVPTLTTALLLAAGAPAGAQDFPSRTIQLVVPFHAGGSTTALMRQVAPLLAERLGQQVVVVNKPGGAGTIGMGAVAGAAPDGHTLGTATLAFAANPGMLGDKLPYDTRRSFVPVTLVARIPLVLTVNPALGVRTLPELLALARSRPGALNYGSAGIASSGHLGGGLLESAAGIRMVHIPFGATGSGTSLASGDTQLQLAPVPSSLPLVRSGRAVAIGVASLQPVAVLPGVPTLASQGLPGFEASDWTGIVAPAGTPPAVVQRLRDEVARVLQDPALRQRLEALGAEVVGGTPAEFQDFLARELDKWTKVAAHLRAAEDARR